MRMSSVPAWSQRSHAVHPDPGPDTIAYLQYESPADMQAIYSHITDTIAPGLPQDGRLRQRRWAGFLVAK